MRDLNRIYREIPALHEVDFDGQGFEWIDWEDREGSILSWIRRDRHGGFVVCVTNFTPVVRYDYRVGVPAPGRYDEVLNTDAESYGGSNVGNAGGLQADDTGAHGRPQSLNLTIPPLATVILRPADSGGH